MNEKETTKQNDIIAKYCEKKTCEVNLKNMKTSGNDPTISTAMRYSQYIKNSKRFSSQQQKENLWMKIKT